MTSKPRVVFVLGGPGAGKGTQCERVAKDLGFVHLSAGELLREEKKTGSEAARIINERIDQGCIVPVEITLGLLDKAMRASGRSKFLIDGFPRNADNLQGWERDMAHKVDLKFVLFLECETETCIRRVLERGKSSGRDDDTIEVLRKRLETYDAETRPIVEVYEARGMLRRVAADAPVDQVYAAVYDLLKDV